MTTFTLTEQRALVFYVMTITHADGVWEQNERNLMNALGNKFLWTNSDMGAAAMMSDITAKSAVLNMANHKKRLFSSILISAAMANGKGGGPQMDICCDILTDLNLPMDIQFTDALNATHAYLGC